MSTPEPRTATFDPAAHTALLTMNGSALAEANTLVVDSDAMYEEGGALLAQVKGSKNRLEEVKESLISPIRQLDRAVRALFDPAIKARESAEALIKSKMLTYRAKKEAEAEAARKEAEERARKERERLEREAVAARAKAEQEATEARRKAEEAEATRKKAEAEGNARAAAAAAAQAAKLQEQAQQKAEAGERQAAELTERAALTSAQPAAAPAVPKAAGTRVSTKFKGRVKDKEKLVASIMKNPRAYLDLVDINESKLNKMSNAQGKGLEAVLDGVEVYPDATLASKAA